MITKNDYKHIFCLEGPWDEINEKLTVKPILELLKKKYDPYLKYSHKKCVSKAKLERLLTQWSLEDHLEYPILYLAFHGQKEQLILSDNTVISLKEIAKLLKNKCTGRIIVFGSCSTLDIDKHDINDFVKATSALAVCGYKTDIDWMQSAAHNLLMFEALQSNEYSKRGINSIKNNLEKIATQFKGLGFEMVAINEV